MIIRIKAMNFFLSSFILGMAVSSFLLITPTIYPIEKMVSMNRGGIGGDLNHIFAEGQYAFPVNMRVPNQHKTKTFENVKVHLVQKTNYLLRRADLILT